jgi:ABC-type maltose transport system permease subunit
VSEGLLFRRTGGGVGGVNEGLPRGRTGGGACRAFVDVTFPLVRSALLAGGLLAFALSFDEIVVTTFTAGLGIETLPIWIFENMTRPQQAPRSAWWPRYSSCSR